jgi:hydrogenase/urease accessory protein HupE
MSSPYSNDPVPQPRSVVSAQQARQGATGHNVRYVLGFSVAAIIIAFAIIGLVYFV